MIGLGSDKKKKLGPLDKKLKWYVWQLVNINQGSFIFKIMNFKEIHTFSLFIKKEKLPLLPNLTQFYIPGNPNLKMNLYRKLHFLKNKDPCPHHRAQGTTRTKKNKKMRKQNNWYVLSWPLGQHWGFKQFFFSDLNIPTNIPTK